MNLTEIQDLIKLVAKSGVSEVEIEKKDFKIAIKTDTGKKKNQPEANIIQQLPIGIPQQIQPVVSMPVQQPVIETSNGVNTTKTTSDNNTNYITIKSPMIGTFYRASSPEQDPFVQVDDNVKKGDVICIVEAMKLFNEIESEISGKIVKVLVEDASPVEFDQPLFLVDPN